MTKAIRQHENTEGLNDVRKEGRHVMVHCIGIGSAPVSRRSHITARRWSWQCKAFRGSRGKITVKEADLARVFLQYHDRGVHKLVRLGDDNIMHIRARSRHKTMLQSVYMHPDIRALASTCDPSA